MEKNPIDHKTEAPSLLLITPPFTQLNTPYPATPYLTGYLQSQGYRVSQADLGIETILILFSRPGLTELFGAIRAGSKRIMEEVKRFLLMEDRYLDTIEPVIRFLQGADPSLATQICGRRFLPEGPRFGALEEDRWAFGTLGTADRAKHLASLYLDDLADLIRATVSPHFGLSRYAERLAASATHFDRLYDALHSPPGWLDRISEEALARRLRGEERRPGLVGITIPFPGNLYGALRSAALIRRTYPEIKIALGGGYVNTELRDLAEPRLFDFVDFVVLDAGERPLLSILKFLSRPEKDRRDPPLCRTFIRRKGEVFYINNEPAPDIPFSEIGTPTYRGLPLRRYLSIVEMLNPMRRLWSDGRWNKLTVAHGCYWKKCSFCDVGLDYIRRYEPAPATLLADRIDALIEETGESGFHFVDEAAPPSRLADLALELLDRGRSISWWGNIRFEEAFTPDLCRLLSASGCIAVTGGIEVASDRLLALMEKGVDVAQAARVTHAFARAGILVHAYLMYGFPTETAKETVESLERVRQFFDAGTLQSAFWHRFVATRHSPVGLNPSAYGIEITGPAPGPFANNDLTHVDPKGCDPERFGPGLAKAVYNYMHGIGMDADVRSWFDFPTPRPHVPPDLISAALRDAPSRRDDLERRMVWIGDAPSIDPAPRQGPKKAALTLHGREEAPTIRLEPAVADWLHPLLKGSRPRGRKGAPYLRLSEAQDRYPTKARLSFKNFLKSKEWKTVRNAGLLLI
ncbi:MAG TPA: radical SAM protein [Candidatus Manganitrophaceae bacterium]|nr:radical SAM protein [Candidatus Manganitrophaceae bacterium]